MGITSYDHHPTLRHEERDALGTALQAVLVDLVDLGLAAKQLHWNVSGPLFRPLHFQLDELAEAAHTLSDMSLSEPVLSGGRRTVGGRSSRLIRHSRRCPMASSPTPRPSAWRSTC